MKPPVRYKVIGAFNNFIDADGNELTADQVNALIAERDALKVMLRKHTYSAFGTKATSRTGFCVECGRPSQKPHAPGCELNSLIGG